MGDNKKFDLDEILTFFKTINPNKSQSTYTTMKYNLMRISKMAKIDFTEINELILQPKYLECAMNKYSVNTQIQTILGIELWIKYKLAKLSIGSKSKIEKYNTLKLKWDGILKSLCNEKNETINKNEMTETEKNNWIDYDDLLKKWVVLINNKLDDNTPKNVLKLFTEWRDITMASLFILIPPTRIGNYETMRIRYMKTQDAKSLKQDRNYLMIDERPDVEHKYTLCFNKYKTAKFVGQVCEPITQKKMIQVLDKYIQLRLVILPINKYKYQETDTLFINGDTLTQLSQSYITETLKKTTKKYIDKKLSCDIFRKIYLTWFLSDNTKSINDKQKLAKFVGQTYQPSMMEKYKKITDAKKNQPILVVFD